MVITPLFRRVRYPRASAESQSAAEIELENKNRCRPDYQGRQSQDSIRKIRASINLAAHRANFKERAEKIAFVKGDNEALFMDVARAIDIMRGAGIDKIGLITAKLEQGSKLPVFRSLDVRVSRWQFIARWSSWECSLR